MTPLDRTCLNTRRRPLTRPVQSPIQLPGISLDTLGAVSSARRRDRRRGCADWNWLAAADYFLVALLPCMMMMFMCMKHGTRYRSIRMNTGLSRAETARTNEQASAVA